MKRLFHNFLQSLRKDSGAHFTYNLGVSFVRAGCIMLVLALLLFCAYLLNFGRGLEYVGETNAALNGKWYYNDTNTGFSWIDENFANYRYYLVFDFKLSIYDERFYSTSEYVDHTTYKRFDMKDMGVWEIPMHVYWSDSEGYYLSDTDPETTLRKFREQYPPKFLRLAAFWTFVLALPVLIVGLREERIAMKYPRSDVNIEEHAIVIAPDEDDDLIKEFEEEYRRQHPNWAENAPAGGTAEPKKK